MKNNHVSNLIAIVISVYCGSALADFKVEEKITAKSSIPSYGISGDRGGAGLTQIGLPNASQQTVRGMAKEVSLLIALKQIVPSGWKAKRGGGLDVNQLVSWKGDNRSWVDVLQELAVSNNFSAAVDWQKQEVTVAPAAFIPTGDGLRPIGVVSDPVVAPMPKVWVLSPKFTLHENIDAWAKEAGWTVSWAAVDYPISNTVSLTGMFDDEENGPFKQLGKAYESAAQPLTFTYYSNKVIRVENASFKQINVKDQVPNHRAMQ